MWDLGSRTRDQIPVPCISRQILNPLDHQGRPPLVSYFRFHLYSQVALVVKNPPASTEDIGDIGLIPGSGRFPWRRKWQPAPVFLPGESHGQSSLCSTLHEVTKSWTWLKQLSMHISDIRWYSSFSFRLTWYDNLWVHPCCCKWHCFILFDGWVIFHCLYVPHLLYLFICRWTFKLLPLTSFLKVISPEIMDIFHFPPTVHVPRAVFTSVSPTPDHPQIFPSTCNSFSFLPPMSLLLFSQRVPVCLDSPCLNFWAW